MNNFECMEEDMKYRRFYIEAICKKLRETQLEYPETDMLNSVIIGNEDGFEQIGGVKYLFAPTISLTLGNCSFKVTRFFEDC